MAETQDVIEKIVITDFESEWWCARHWEPFKTGGPLLHAHACDNLTLALLNYPQFIAAVSKVERQWGCSLLEARRIVVTDWANRNPKLPICCILGDGVMAQVKSKSTR